MTTSAYVSNRNAAEAARVERVALTVNDLGTTQAFYRDIIGLESLSSDAESATLGAGGTALLELRRDRHARRKETREAGLFHTAFLLPSFAALGSWLLHASELKTPILGASDHWVSEALYLADPEGNGIEIYADRPRERWTRRGGEVIMPSERLDHAALASCGQPWSGAPASTIVGHVHLQVGDVDAAEAFLTERLGLHLTHRYPGGRFFAWDDYHHHLAANVWNSRGARPRSTPVTGVAEIVILPPASNRLREAGLVEDPWGTVFRVADHG